VLNEDYSVIHIASHFKFSPGSDGDSFLLLGDGDNLKVAEIDEISYPLHDVDLLTLSACQTGLGGDGVAGQEFESFSVLAQQQGASSVMATLWEVADDSTGRFMQYYYQLHEAYGLGKSEALRLTQELFIHGELSMPGGEQLKLRGVGVADIEDTGVNYSHPYFWAPFVLSGNWL
jgi:CHAT domain-containing protein